MKNIFYLILIAFVGIIGCESSKKYLQHGDYESAVRVSVRKLQKNKNKEKEIDVLDRAYALANQKDENRIKYLHTEGQPERWDEIFKIYSQMNVRQNLVMTVMPLNFNGRVINYPRIDYDKKIVEAKRNAAEFYYAKGKQTMQKDDKFSYRDAYYQLKKAKEYNSTFQDINDLLDECKFKGTSYVLLIAKNSTHLKLNNDFMINLLNQETGSLNSEWTQYYNQKQNNMTYDFNIYIELKLISFTPERVGEKRFKESAKVKDGWEYELDGNGNVKKDSLGNDIKKPKYISVICEVTDFIQSKAVHIEGEVKYEDAYNKQIIRSRPIAADHFFNHTYSTANGDLRALSTESKRRMDLRPIPFPNDWDMIYAAGNTLKGVISQVLFDNRGFMNKN